MNKYKNDCVVPKQKLVDRRIHYLIIIRFRYGWQSLEREKYRKINNIDNYVSLSCCLNDTISGVASRVAIRQLPPRRNFIATYLFLKVGNCLLSKNVLLMYT